MENEIDLKILIALHRVVNAVDSKTAKLVKAYGLSLGQFAVLEALYHKGEMTVGQVQEKILSSTGTIPVIIKNLEKRQFISHKEDENDKRNSDLALLRKNITEEEKLELLLNILFTEERDKVIYRNRYYKNTNFLSRRISNVQSLYFNKGIDFKKRRLKQHRHN